MILAAIGVVVVSYGFPFWSAVAQGAPVFDVGHVDCWFLL